MNAEKAMVIATEAMPSTVLLESMTNDIAKKMQTTSIRKIMIGKASNVVEQRRTKRSIAKIPIDKPSAIELKAVHTWLTA